jgi:arginine utilization regulatory protein
MFMEHPVHRSLRQPIDIGNIDFVSVLDSFDDGVIISDCHGKILYYNHAQAVIDDLDRTKVIGRKVTDIYQLSGETSLIMHCIRTRSAVRHRTFFYKTVNGKIAHTIHSVFPLLDGEQIVGAICFVRDYKLLKEHAPQTLSPEEKPQKLNGTRYAFADIVGANQELIRSISTARGAAESKSPVLLIGETGTGKELFAQSIHNHSSRKDKKYVAINCAAIPDNLLEGLLFGTVKGAFTGAIDRPGLFERANGSTLFLDELLTMPMPLQAKLLRVLQEKKVSRLGSEKEIEFDIKIISSVSKPPRDAIRDGELRTDLFYRLGVVMVKIPSLRQRADDIPLLVDHFLGRLNNNFGTQVQGVSDEVMDLFSGYSWPGNIRELEHLLEGAMNIVGMGEKIELRHFSAAFDTLNVLGESSLPSPSAIPVSFPHEQPRAAAPETSPTGFSSNLQDEHKVLEKTALQRALHETAGNVSRAATLLGISRQLLNYKMKKHGLDRKLFEHLHP